MLVSLLPQLGVGHPAVKDCSYRASIDIGQYCSDSPSIFADSVEGKDGDDATAACQTICKRRPSCMYASIWPSEANKGSQKWCRLTESCEAVWPDPAGNGVAIFTCSPPSPPPLPLPPPPKACSKREASNGDYCGDLNPVFSNFVEGYDTKTVCRNMCQERPECNFASAWPSQPSGGGLYRGWCRLTSHCPGFWPDPAGNDVAVFSCSSRAPLMLPVDPRSPSPPPNPLPPLPPPPRPYPPMPAQFVSLGLDPRLLDERGRGRLAVRC